MEPGFSTADSVSSLAGRGVGMDVVKSETEGLGGRIEISSKPGQGSAFRLYLPPHTGRQPSLDHSIGHALFCHSFVND
ncbi:MAG: hypothetical protein IPO13_12115 [Rhodocyclaceae bacterium]|nr:hypothetical protein [Rhodocyclaceae bacterium]